MIVGAFPPEGRNVFGGIVTACRLLLRSSLTRRADVITLDSTQLRNPLPALPVRAVFAIRRLLSFMYKFERNRPDVVLLFASASVSLAEKGVMARYARARRSKSVIFPRAGRVIEQCAESRLTRLWVLAAFRGAWKIFCQSNRWRDFAVNVVGVQPDDAPVITNWTATPELLAIGRERLPRPQSAPRLIFIGWLERNKGVEELLLACAALARNRAFTLDVLGEGNFSSAAREIVARNALEDRVRFRGWLRGSALLEAYSAADVLVLPSWAEGLPNVMIEAMAAGLAVVVTNVGGVSDYVTNGVHALVIPPRSQPALEAALAAVIDSASLRAQLGSRGREMVERTFSVESAVDRMLAEFESLARIGVTAPDASPRNLSVHASKGSG